MIRKIRKSVPYFLPVVALVLIFGLVLSRILSTEPTPPEPEVTITTVEAEEYIGTPAEVCGTVTSADFIPDIGGEPTFLNFGEPYPNQHFTAVIWGENRGRWQRLPEQMFLNQSVCVSGQIRVHEGTPQIVIERADQVRISELAD